MNHIERIIQKAHWQLEKQFNNVDILIHFWRLLGRAPKGFD